MRAARSRKSALQVLSNQTPPYAIAGGVREALGESSGTVFAIENNEMVDAMMLFAELEGIDIDPEAGIATAALIRAVADGSRRTRPSRTAQRDRRRPQPDACARRATRGRRWSSTAPRSPPSATMPCGRCSFRRSL